MHETLTQWAHSLLFAVDKRADCSQSLIFPYDGRDRALCGTGSHLGLASSAP